MLSNASLEERLLLEGLLKDHSEDEKVKFLTQYAIKRKDPLHILLLTLIGLFGVAGIQRFVMDDILLGILYLLTGGFCVIGTIIDAVRYQKLALDYNTRMANIVYVYTIRK